jgi:carboxylesterase
MREAIQPKQDGRDKMSIDSSGLLAGGKTGVLVLHDLGQSADDLRHLARHLNQCGLTVAVPQLSAFNSAKQGQVTASALIREAELSLARLKERCSDLVIIGVAYGAMLALEVARQNKSSVQAVVMVEPRAWIPGLRLPFAAKVSGYVRQAWIAEAAGKVRALASRARKAPAGSVAGWTNSQIMGLSQPIATSTQTAEGMLIGAGQILDCLHATLPEIKQPVLVIRRQTAPRAVIDSSILLQRRLGGRVETGVLDQSAYADAGVELHQVHVADRVSRFLTAVMDELTTRRDNELRRQRAGAGRSNAA